MTRKERIERERAALKCAPWEFAPSEVDYGPVPFPPDTAGHQSWKAAVALKREMAAARRKRKAAKPS